MCGIVCSVGIVPAGTCEAAQTRLEELYEINALRGPDYQSTEKLTVAHGKVTVDLSFFTSVLHLRGGELPTGQPHVRRDPLTNEITDVFCWNGEVFEGLEIGPKENDGKTLFEALVASEAADVDRGDPDAAVVRVFSRIEGPYAMVYYRSSTNKLYFARDPLGRRSLLVRHPSADDPRLILASTSAGFPGAAFEELSTDKIYYLDLEAVSVHGEGSSEWTNLVVGMNRQPGNDDLRQELISVQRLNKTLPSENYRAPTWDSPSETMGQAIGDFIRELDTSVKLRVQNIPRWYSPVSTLTCPPRGNEPRVAVLFSGGIDCTILTYLAHRHLPLDEPIDLLNVAFENPRSLKAKSQYSTNGTGKKVPRQSSVHPQGGPTDAIAPQAVAPDSFTEYDNGTHGAPGHSTGLGSVIYDVPDRLTGLEQVEELRRVCPGRTFNFVEVNVPYEECQRLRPTVEALMYPSRTVMDLSLALALYFASRGVGIIRTDPLQYQPYESPARVLLSGLGSDELLGGYSRHRNAFSGSGWQGLIDELQLDLTRLPTRNLGRDDRVISTHGKETRYPFLSLSFVSFVARLPVEVKLDPRLGEGRGDKMLLRLAAERLGLVQAAFRKKRAMQFGSRSARMEGGKNDRKGDLVLEQ